MVAAVAWAAVGNSIDLAELLLWQRLLAADLSASRGRALREVLFREGLSAFEAQLTATQLANSRRVAESEFARLAEGVRVVSDADYPAPLGEVPQPPAGLFVRGDWSATHAPCVAIVGTRGAGTYGKACAQKFAEHLAQAGVTVVSGGAYGIDAAAHAGALGVGGRTVAVVANGLDSVYPQAHAGLFRRIAEQGAVVSQFGLGTKPEAYRFLARNDLIAALCTAVIVIEAPTRSGALRTAHTAAEWGREVFVVPGTIDNAQFYGGFNLLRDGATLAYHPDQVLEGIGELVMASATEAAPPPPGLPGQILAALTTDPIPVDLLADRLQADVSDLLVELTMMEIDGVVLRDGRGYAKRP